LKEIRKENFMKIKASTFLMGAVLMALAVLSISPEPLQAQIGNSGKTASQINVSPGELFLIDGRASVGPKGRLRCGQASPIAMGRFGNPDAGGAVGQTVHLDLSFGLLPFTRVRFPSDPFSPSESYIGSWTVRNIYPAEKSRPETVASNYFRGPLTSGSASSMSGGNRTFDLYGVTNFSSQVCGTEGDYDTNLRARRYVRLTGACGNDQEVRFQMARHPPVDHGGDLYFEESDIFAYGTFRGNIACGVTTDRSRVRTNLSK
jgi:hypothetical protein